MEVEHHLTRSQSDGDRSFGMQHMQTSIPKQNHSTVNRIPHFSCQLVMSSLFRKGFHISEKNPSTGFVWKLGTPSHPLFSYHMPSFIILHRRIAISWGSISHFQTHPFIVLVIYHLFLNPHEIPLKSIKHSSKSCRTWTLLDSVQNILDPPFIQLSKKHP